MEVQYIILIYIKEKLLSTRHAGGKELPPADFRVVSFLTAMGRARVYFLWIFPLFCPLQ